MTALNFWPFKKSPATAKTPPAEAPPSRHRTDLPEDNNFGAGIDV